MPPRDPALTDDMRAAVALRHLDARDRARGNANARESEGRRMRRGGHLYASAELEWAGYWRAKAREHEADARAILPPADSWGATDWPAPAYVGGSYT